MEKRLTHTPPRSFFALLSTGGSVACGIYLGMIHIEGALPGHMIRAAAFGIFGLVMLWGVLGRRNGG